MKRIWIITCTLASFLGGFLAPMRYKENSKDSIKQEQGNLSSQSEVSRFLKQLTSSSSLRFDDFQREVQGLKDPLTLSSKDLAVSYLEGDKEDKLLSGHLTLGLGSLSLPFGVYLGDKKAAIEYQSKIYTRDASSIGDIVGVLSSSGLISLPSSDTLDTKNVLDRVNEILGKIQDGIYSSTDTVSSADGSHTFAFDTGYGELNRTSDRNLLFTSLSTPSSLSFEDKEGKTYSVTLNGSGEQSLSSSFAVGYDKDRESVNLDGLDPLFVTFLNRAKKKAFSASVDFIRKDEKDLSSSEKGFQIQVDADLDQNRVQASIGQGDVKDPYVKGEAKVYYQKDKTFIDINKQSMGHLDNQKVKDVLSSLSHISGSGDTASLIENVASLFSDCAFKDLLNGDYSKLTELVSYLTSNTDGTFIELGILAKAFGLCDDPSREVKVKLSRQKDAIHNENEIESISVESLPFKGESVSLCFKIDSLSPSFETVKEEDYSNSYNGILPRLDKRAPYLEKRQFGVDFSVNRIEKGYTNEDGSYKTMDFAGEANRDRSDSDHPSIGVNLNIKGADKVHRLDVRYLNDTAYRSLDQARKQCIDKTEAGAVFSALSDGIAKLTKADESASDSINKILDKFSSIFSLSDGLDLNTLFQFVSVSPLSTDDALILELDPSIIDTAFKKGGTLTREVSDKGIASLSILGLTYEDLVLNRTLERKDYTSVLDRTYLDGSSSFSVNDFIGKEVENFSFFVTGLFDLLPGNEKKFSVGLDRTRQDRLNADSYPLGIKGSIAFDYVNSQYAGELHIDRDEYSYDPSIDFYYSKDRVPYQNNIEDNLCVKYYHQDNGQDPKDTSYIGARIGNQSIQDRTDQIQSIKKTNLFYPYIGSIVQIYNRIRSTKDDVENQGSSPTPDFLSFLSLLDGIDSVEITNGKIHIVIENSLLSSDATGTSDLVRNYQTIDEDDWKITSISFDSLRITNKEQADGSRKESRQQIKGTLTITGDSSADFDKYASIFNDSFKESSIDFNSLPLRTSLILNTTDQNDFSLSGALKIDLRIVGINSASIDANVTAAVHVEKGTNGNKADVSAYILVESDGTKTEYYIRPKNADCLIVKHYSNETKVWLVTQKQRTSHIGYYLFALGFNFEAKQFGTGVLAWKSYLVDQIENSSSSSDSSDSTDKGGIAGMGIYPEKRVKGRSYDGDKTFTMNLDLSSVDVGVSVISFTNTLPIEVTYKTDENGVDKLDTITMNQKSVLKILGNLATGDVSFNASLNPNPIQFRPSMKKVEDYYYSKTNNQDDYYVISKVERKNSTFLGTGNYWIEATGTGTLLTISDSDTTLPSVI